MADFKVTELDSQLDFDKLPYWDVVIIGAGPAGLAASLTTAHRGLTTLVIEAKSEPGGQPRFLYAHKRIVDIPGFPEGITGEELSDRTYRHNLAFTRGRTPEKVGISTTVTASFVELMQPCPDKVPINAHFQISKLVRDGEVWLIDCPQTHAADR